MAPEITLNLDMHIRTQITRPPTIQKGCQSFCHAVYERLNISVMVVIIVKTIKKLEVKVVVINGGNMDLGTNGFTSDVSLPRTKANKTRAIVKKLQLGN